MLMDNSDLETAETWKEKGNKHFSEANYHLALEAYEEAIRISPEVATYYNNASACCAKLEEFGRAALFASEALRLEPGLLKSHFRHAIAMMGLQQWRPALDEFRKVAKGTEGPIPFDLAKRIIDCEKELQKIAFAKAIHVDVFTLDLKHIKELSVDASYQGPVIEDDKPVDLSFLESLLLWYKEEKRLHPKYLYRILFEARQIFKKDPNIVDIEIPENTKLSVCGDIHGQFFDLLHIFELNGLPSEKHTYLFNGDLVDRGSHSVEVLMLMLTLKVIYPKNFYITRGNHEAETVNRMHGFFEEVNRKYDDSNMFHLMNQVLGTLPLAHLIKNKIFVVHGGLPNSASTITLDEIQSLDRFKEPAPGSIISQMLWSDPQDSNGISMSHRGEGVLFGPDVTDSFLKLNKLDKIIRSHVWESTGYREQHDGKCITIFSAPNYTGAVSKGALMNFNSDLNFEYFQYDAALNQGKSKPRPIRTEFDHC